MKGMTVILHEKVQTGVDDFNAPVFVEIPVAVHDVLVGQPSTDDVTNSLSLYGKRIDYILGLPKGDEHNWEDAEIDFFGKTFHSFGNVIEGIEANVPTRWHKQVRVQRYG